MRGRSSEEEEEDEEEEDAELRSGYEKSLKIYDFVGFKRYPGTTGQLSTCRIDWRCQIQHPD